MFVKSLVAPVMAQPVTARVVLKVTIEKMAPVLRTVGLDSTSMARAGHVTKTVKPATEPQRIARLVKWIGLRMVLPAC